MTLLNVLACVSLVLSFGTGIYCASRRILGWPAVFMMMLLTFAIVAVSLRTRIAFVTAGYIAFQLLLCVLCMVNESTMPGSPSRKKSSRKHNDDDEDEDEYISLAPTMTVRQIVSEYTRNPQAEELYTNRPMNVVGLITRITNGGTYSHVELDERFMCVCPQGSVRNLKPLQKVCITGTLRGKYLLDDCLMVKHPV